MPLAQKIAGGLTLIALGTTLFMKDRTTVKAIGALDKLGRGLLGTAMGTARPA